MDIHRLWDAIVIGGGMAGGAVAYSLSNKGHSVLLIEKGRADAAAQLKSGASVGDDDNSGERLAAGQWPYRLRAAINGFETDIWPTVGCGLGGSTLHYAATLERLDQEDFLVSRTPHGVSQEWPFSYMELEPYYRNVEELFYVNGSVDPLETNVQYELGKPPAMSENDQSLFDIMVGAGLHPYRIHMALKYVSGCNECLQKYCDRSCRSDAYNRFIEPALATGNLSILDEATVKSITASKYAASAVELTTNEGTLSLSAKQIILAAGALFSPVILLSSKNEYWPNGIGNDKGLVGRNLMFHATDFFAVWPRRGLDKQGAHRSVAFRDYYEFEGTKLGEFQSMGLSAGYGEILHYWRMKLNQSPLGKVPLLGKLLSAPAFIGSLVMREATVFATIVEDFPYLENRVQVDETSPAGVRFDYSVSEELTERVLLMRKLIKRVFSRSRSIFLNQPVSLSYGHPCGTCRAGTDPATSVVDQNCKVHGLENLYVADGSIMPSSGGTNPSLTIAANALRVADIVDKALASQTGRCQDSRSL